MVVGALLRLDLLVWFTWRCMAMSSAEDVRKGQNKHWLSLTPDELSPPSTPTPPSPTLITPSSSMPPRPGEGRRDRSSGSNPPS
ncbi:hypothetical protein KUCAC02_000840 [Chaenocephalus aceratus]|uniref:Uncharacterized protein n=1 Tax=Chaenocephalus aceratus TaxID=36190 RepID=A0ACB9W6Q2_CHAAC|nr:hypothetical protein KUCAC02_000840 [Chaenocephalus aceratus]